MFPRHCVLLASALLAILPACRTPTPPADASIPGRDLPPLIASTLYARDVFLSPSAPEDTWCGVRLIHVSPAGEATLRVLPSGAELRAAPGGHFSGEGFGRIGLAYLRFDPRTQTVALRRYWCETTASP